MENDTFQSLNGLPNWIQKDEEKPTVPPPSEKSSFYRCDRGIAFAIK